MTGSNALGLTLRHYLFPQEGKPVRLSQRLVDGLVAGRDWMPDYARTRQKVLAIVLESTDGTPQAIVRTDASIWEFDPEGGIADGLRASIHDAMDFIFAARTGDGTVVPIGPALQKKRHAAKYSWEPEQADIDLIVADIWPEGRSERLVSAKGKAPKKPPLTREAKHALREATEPFWGISMAIDRLKEQSLSGLAFEARERAEGDELGPLFLAVAELAETRFGILRRRRSSKGTWYGFVEVTRWSPDRETGEVIATYHERCEGKRVAIEAARRLLIEHAEKFSDDITVEAGIETDLEWDAAARASSGAV